MLVFVTVKEKDRCERCAKAGVRCEQPEGYYLMMIRWTGTGEGKCPPKLSCLFCAVKRLFCLQPLHPSKVSVPKKRKAGVVDSDEESGRSVRRRKTRSAVTVDEDEEGEDGGDEEEEVEGEGRGLTVAEELYNFDKSLLHLQKVGEDVQLGLVDVRTEVSRVAVEVGQEGVDTRAEVGSVKVDLRELVRVVGGLAKVVDRQEEVLRRLSVVAMQNEEVLHMLAERQGVDMVAMRAGWVRRESGDEDGEGSEDEGGIPQSSTEVGGSSGAGASSMATD